MAKRFFIEELARFGRFLTAAGAVGDDFESRIRSLDWLLGDAMEDLLELAAFARRLHATCEGEPSGVVRALLDRFGALCVVCFDEKIEDEVEFITGAKISDRVAQIYAEIGLMLERATGSSANNVRGLAAYSTLVHPLIEEDDELREAITELADLRADLLYRSRKADIFVLRRAHDLAQKIRRSIEGSL